MTDEHAKKIPVHIGIIMDGNGRYAKERGQLRSMGHKAGVENVRRILRHCSNIGVKHLTLYAFSTENWKRPKDEVGFLMKLLLEYLKKELAELNEKNVKINTIGDISKLPAEVYAQIVHSIEATKNNTGLNVHFALNYGSRAEILRAVNTLAQKFKGGEIQEIDEQAFEKELYTCGIPDPDLIIRTSGEKRISNFLLYQSAYSEYIFVDKYWPDFSESDLDNAIEEFLNRKRNYGGV